MHFLVKLNPNMWIRNSIKKKPVWVIKKNKAQNNNWLMLLYWDHKDVKI